MDAEQKKHDHSKLINAGPIEVNLEGVPELLRLLAQAAELAANMGVPPESFTTAAWQAYLQASPLLAEHLAQLRFNEMLEEMRSAGRLAKA